jgi:NAD-dependent DNA ligase
MYAHGYTNIESIIGLRSAQPLLDLPGVKDAMANKIYEQIKNGRNRANLVAVAANSGYFGKNMGQTRLQVVEDNYGLRKLGRLTKAAIIKRVMAMPGFSDVTATAVAVGLAPFLAWVDKLPLKFSAPKKLEPTGTLLNGQSVVFTGFRSSELEEKIKRQGGKIASGVSGTTTILITKDVDGSSSKIQKARQLGVKIYSPEQFVRKYKL